MRRFEYLEARTLRQAIGMLQRHGQQARVVAGSTDFLVRWRAGFWHPDYVVNIQHIPGLGRLTYSRRNGLRMGALVTIQTLEQHPAIRQHYPALAAAAASFAGVQVRNLATVGGNICNASPSGDMLPAMLAYGAECRLSGPDGNRQVPLEQLFTGPGQTVLAHDEVLTEITLPLPETNTGSLYIKHSPRGAMDIATVGVASAVTVDRSGVCTGARIALGAVAPIPLRARSAEDMLLGRRLDAELLQAAADQSMAEASPIDDVRGTARYRSQMVGVLTRRTLEHAASAAAGGGLAYEDYRRFAIQTAI
jgi:carbon-monoxide dehydrogenase medium subunit